VGGKGGVVLVSLQRRKEGGGRRGAILASKKRQGRYPRSDFLITNLKERKAFLPSARRKDGLAFRKDREKECESFLRGRKPGLYQQLLSLSYRQTPKEKKKENRGPEEDTYPPAATRREEGRNGFAGGIYLQCRLLP